MALYRLINKKENIDALVSIDCGVAEMGKLIDIFNEENKAPMDNRAKKFVEFVNKYTPHVAELLDNPVLFDF